MIFVYLKEYKRKNNLLFKLRIRFKNIFNIIDIVNNGSYLFIYLPIANDRSISKYRIKRIGNKVIKKLKKIETNKVVLSEFLNKMDDLKIFLQLKNVTILNGRYLFKCLYNEIIDYILNIRNEKIQNSEIWITINDFSEINNKILIDIAKRVRTLSIVTNNINRLRRIEKYLYNEYGILINISNNKKNALINAKIILNFDFSEEYINKYRINTKAIIINMQEKIKIKSKKFNGININYYNINIPEEYRIEGFKDQEIYESKIYNLNLSKIQDMFERDKINIENLIGDKGIINVQEFK